MRINTLFDCQLERRQAVTCVVMAAAFNLTGFLLLLAFEYQRDAFPFWPPFASATLGGILTVGLVRLRGRVSLTFTKWAFAGNTLAVTAALAFVNQYYIHNVTNWVPFRPAQLGVLYVAMIAPSFATGLFGIAAHAGATLLQFYSLPEDVAARLPPGEPLPILAFAIASFFILVLRYRALVSQMECQQALIAASTSKALADRSLHIRDLMNSPLQVLRSSIDLLHGDIPADVYNRCERAVDRLNSLNALLSEHDKSADCTASFDARAALKQRFD